MSDFQGSLTDDHPAGGGQPGRHACNRVNDLTLKIANVNGTGSASANGLLMKAIFRMGVPVVGKNFFPSNIQGLPTWYEIRASGDGYLARSGQVDIMVAMNAETYADDLREVRSGGYLIYDATWPRSRLLHRDDITILGVPLAQMVNERFDHARTRILMKNVAYVGVLAALLNIDRTVITQLLEETFARKPALIPSNQETIDLGYEYAKTHFNCPLPLHLEPLNRTAGHIMIDGNTAAALGCLYAGATVGAWYPITPSTSLMDAFSGLCKKHRVDAQTGERHYCIVQAEDELAAVGMVLGAAWSGARAFTPTSGPGISLMSEFIGYAYFTEIPLVLFDVQRVGPSTGMPTRTQQCDILTCAYASHGDTKQVLLFPANPAECFELAVTAFDLAEHLQTPVITLLDLDIGMNDWMVPAMTWNDNKQPDRGKVFTAAQLAGMSVFHRYSDVDGDGICARTFPGEHPRGAYFTRGSGHNAKGGYTEKADEYQQVMDRLSLKFETAKQRVPEPVVQHRPDIKNAIVSLGSCDDAVREAIDHLAGQGIHLNYLRIRAFPFNETVEAFLREHEQVFVVEQNRDAQLKSLLILETAVSKDKLHSVLHYNGLPISATSIVEAVTVHYAAGAAA